jgi:hypothetical protein
MVNDLRMYRLLKLKGGSGQLIQKTADAETLDAQGYAVAWGMVHHLATNRSEEFKAYLKQLSGLPPLRVRAAQPSADLNELFSKHFGDDFAALERDVRKHLTSRTLMKKYRDPVANQTRYLVKRIHKKGKIYDVAGVLTASPTAAREWKEQQEKLFEKASFYTVVCETEQKAAYEWRKLKSVGR